MSSQMSDENKRWSAKRKSALVLEIIQGKTTVAEASRQFDLTPSELESWVDQAKESLLKQRIQQTMAEHSHAQFRNGSVAWKKTADAKVLDSKTLSQEHPDLVAPYFTTRAGSRRFTVLA